MPIAAPIGRLFTLSRFQLCQLLSPVCRRLLPSFSFASSDTFSDAEVHRMRMLTVCTMAATKVHELLRLSDPPHFFIRILIRSLCSLSLKFNTLAAWPKSARPRTCVWIACRRRCCLAKLISEFVKIVSVHDFLTFNRLKKCVTIENVAARDPSFAQLNVSRTLCPLLEVYPVV